MFKTRWTKYVQWEEKWSTDCGERRLIDKFKKTISSFLMVSTDFSQSSSYVHWKILPYILYTVGKIAFGSTQETMNGKSVLFI